MSEKEQSSYKSYKNEKSDALNSYSNPRNNSSVYQGFKVAGEPQGKQGKGAEGNGNKVDLSETEALEVNEKATLNGEINDETRRWTLKDYKEGQKGTIISLECAGKLKKRLIEMGLVKGTSIYVEKYAPLRDPIELVVKGYHVSIRREEAQHIIMSPPEQE